MFSLCELMDAKKDYQRPARNRSQARLSMIESMGLQLTPNPNYDAYYGLIDFEFWRARTSATNGRLLKEHIHPLDLAFRLPRTTDVAQRWRLRGPQLVAARLLGEPADEAYEDIGRGVRTLLAATERIRGVQDCACQGSGRIVCGVRRP